MRERYGESVEPAYTDGRDIDLDVGQLLGEAAHQASHGSPDPHELKKAEVWPQLPEPSADEPTPGKGARLRSGEHALTHRVNNDLAVLRM